MSLNASYQILAIADFDPAETQPRRSISDQEFVEGLLQYTPADRSSSHARSEMSLQLQAVREFIQ
jgi:hypothetical protein